MAKVRKNDTKTRMIAEAIMTTAVPYWTFSFVSIFMMVCF